MIGFLVKWFILVEGLPWHILYNSTIYVLQIDSIYIYR